MTAGGMMVASRLHLLPRKVNLTSMYLCFCLYPTYLFYVALRPETMDEWLDSVGLSQYKDVFKKDGITGLNMLAFLDLRGLEYMEITQPIYQNILLNGCKQM
jgi:hypothetical protein